MSLLGGVGLSSTGSWGHVRTLAGVCVTGQRRAAFVGRQVDHALAPVSVWHCGWGGGFRQCWLRHGPVVEARIGGSVVVGAVDRVAGGRVGGVCRRRLGRGMRG